MFSYIDNINFENFQTLFKLKKVTTQFEVNKLLIIGSPHQSGSSEIKFEN